MGKFQQGEGIPTTSECPLHARHRALSFTCTSSFLTAAQRCILHIEKSRLKEVKGLLKAIELANRRAKICTGVRLGRVVGRPCHGTRW